MQQRWDELARQAAGLLGARDVAAGQRVALLADNDPAVLATLWGALRAGIIPVPINTALSDRQVMAMIRDADPRLVLVDAANRPRLAGPALPPVVLLSLQALSSTRPATAVAALPQGRAMHYTSGTSGGPKGVWTGLLEPELAAAWAREEGRANPTGEGDVHLLCSYLFHSGPSRYALNTLNHGGDVIIQPRFDAGATLAAIQNHRVTTAFMVPTHLARLLDHPDLATTDLSSLRWIHHAGAACPEPLKRRAIDVFGVDVLHEFYGATEGQFTAISSPEWLQHPGSVGRARAGRQLEVTDASGNVVPAGTVGTVWVTAPPFARFSYWRQPAATQTAWRGDLFTVGDLGSVDAEGWLTLSGRRSDLILSGGVNVYPAEVEQPLLSHPGVADAAVFGVTDERWGQRVCAAVVLRAGARIDAEELRSYLRQRLAGYQTPKQIIVVDDLPRTASGKVRRSELHSWLP